MALFQVCDHQGCFQHPVHYSGDDLREALAVCSRLMYEGDDDVDPYVSDEEGLLLLGHEVVGTSEEDVYRIYLERKASRQRMNEALGK